MYGSQTEMPQFSIDDFTADMRKEMNSQAYKNSSARSDSVQCIKKDQSLLTQSQKTNVSFMKKRQNNYDSKSS